MTTQIQIKKTRAAIQGLLSLAKRRLSQEELVKLVYFADNRFYESTGRTITGSFYMWNADGPDAVSHAITSEANELADAEFIRMSIRRADYGIETFQYWIDDPQQAWEMAISSLDTGERQILIDIVRQYGQMNSKEIIDSSKQTHPFKEAKQYGLLELAQNDNARQVKNHLNVGDFLKEVELGLDDAEREHWVWDEDLSA